MISLTSFSDPNVRALAWAIGGPSLMHKMRDVSVLPSGEHQEHLELALPWLQSLDDNPESLSDELAKKPTWKVGLLFESLVLYWLEHGSRFTVLGQNVPVKNDERTLGAYDLVVQRADGRVEHWELAIKFYLQKHADSAWDAWVGPNARDRLDLKLNKMLLHQLPLSNTGPGRHALRDLGVVGPVKRRAFIKGMFFTPWQEADPIMPMGADPRQTHGVYVRQSELAAYVDGFPRSRWIQRQKPHWMAPAVSHFPPGFSTDEWLTYYNGDPIKRPEMISRMTPGKNAAYVEQNRFFVVPDSWPNHAQAGQD